MTGQQLKAWAEQVPEYAMVELRMRKHDPYASYREKDEWVEMTIDDVRAVVYPKSVLVAKRLLEGAEQGGT